MADDAQRIAWEWSATGTVWRVHHDGTLTAEDAERARALVAADEARWSRFRADSETTSVTAAAGAFVPVSSATLELLEACRTWVEATGGVFQPLVGAALRAWGYAEPLQSGPPASTRPRTAPIVGTIEVDPVRGAVRIPAGTALDLGGIAKGWIADRAARLLAETDCASVLVDAGGDMVAVAGTHRVEVVHAEHRYASVRLEQGTAIATSGPWARSWVDAGGATAHHLIDPSTGAPGAAVSATVVAPTCAEADVEAKVLALRPERIDGTALAAFVSGPEGERASRSWPSVQAGGCSGTRS